MIKRADGFITIALAISILLTTILLVAMLGAASVNHHIAYRDDRRAQAQFAIDAAVSEALVQLKDTPTWLGTGSVTTYYTAPDRRIAYTTAVTTLDATRKQLSVTAYVYQPASATQPIETMKAAVDLTQDIVTSGPGLNNFAVIGGSGLLELDSGSAIVGGDVYVNGTITLGSGSKIGTSSSPVSVYAAHQKCGSTSDSSYPRICTTADGAGQPISVSSGSVGGSMIYGDVRANNQTNPDRMSNTGLIHDGPVAVASLPAYDRDAQIAAVATTITASTASCTGSTKSWAANIRIGTGTTYVDDDCIVTVNGNAWIQGNLEVEGGGAIMRVAEGVTVPPVLMIDGSLGFIGDSDGELRPNSSGVGFRVITYYALGCGACTTVTSSVLYNNINRVTIDIGSGFSAPKSELYARWSKVAVDTDSQVGALVGQAIAITSGSQLVVNGEASQFTPPTTSPGNWVVTAYRKDYE